MDNPYGVTVFAVDGTAARSTSFWTQFLSDVSNLGLSWVRTQRRWSDIEYAQGQYNWQGLDDDVLRLNAVGVSIAFPIQDAPSWALANPDQTVDGGHYLPDPAMMMGFAQAVAQRYNGKNGHGFIESIEVGNEDFDVYFDQNTDYGNQPYRDVKFFIPCLQACSAAIRAASPATLVGMCGLWWMELPHLWEFLQGIYTAGLKDAFDYCNFHFYNGNYDPLSSQNDSLYHPAFPGAWSALQNVMAINGDGGKAIWCTEFGWTTTSVNQGAPVSQATQSRYYQKLLDSARTSKIVKKCFFYTLDYSGDGMSLVQGTASPYAPTAAYTMLKSYVSQHPQW